MLCCFSRHGEVLGVTGREGGDGPGNGLVEERIPTCVRGGKTPSGEDSPVQDRWNAGVPCQM